MTPPNLADCDRVALATRLTALSDRGYLARQVFRWIHARRECSFERMSDLPATLRARLTAEFAIDFPAVSERRPADDGTIRFVYTLKDGFRVESVYIPGDDDQVTLCLSSQVGCALACTFCVSGLDGVKRNLTVAEMVGQARAMLPGLDQKGPRRTNIVFMGMGEALLNFDALLATISVLSDPDGFGIAVRRMTVSTAGHVPSLKRFGQLTKRPRIAVSLNATTDQLRDQIMPINKAWPLRELLDTCRSITLSRGERLTFEYVLLAGINDDLASARRMPGLLAGISAKVNLIPWNQAQGFSYSPPSDAAIDQFAATLKDRGIVTTVRRRRGADAGAACGQLALHREPVEAAPL